MNFLIIDDDTSTNLTLSKIIQEYNLGEIIKFSYSKFSSDGYLLDLKNIDILIIDLPILIDSKLISKFNGKIIVVSQTNDKEDIVQAYLSGAEYYIIEPINEFEVVVIIKKVIYLIKLQKCLYNIEELLNLA
ncbi:histidine kinase [Clostridium carboxidivorans P7]|uniref:Stage 0 sporulation protein A homolog n=1 Tax=Clostridium carboxidivorans P7 TaxID=536227 RepID=C6PS59_9CLOT|nr:hypothetical protein [Clostridium carboxidivorans]AKN31893.1 histidine kinase [Clostridium carboxidivorans P7]EET87984.1 response regulator receiver protein [Clostridium carboxidivorans P7]